MASDFVRLPIYNAFTSIRFLSIQLHALDLHLLALKTASTPMASQPVPMGDPENELSKGTPKRHSAPQESLSLLEGAGLQVGRMEVDLIHRDTEYSRR